jgi:hypothetical protein
MTTPVSVVHEVVLLDEATDTMVFQFGAFTDQAEAEKVLAQLESEGRHAPLGLNSVRVYATAADWESDR